MNDERQRSPLLRRRGFIGVAGLVLGGAGGFIGSVLAGSAGGYGTEIARAINPPGEIADDASREDPITARIIPERDIDTQGELWVYPGRLSEHPAALQAATKNYESFDQLHRNLYRTGFADAGVSSFKLIVEGNRNVPVQIIGMRAVFERRVEPSPDHTVLAPGPQGTGPLVQIGFDLDEQDPVAHAVDQTEGASIHGEGFLKEPFFSASVTELRRGERQIYQVKARVTKWDADWTVELEIVDRNGLSQRVSAKQNLRTIGLLSTDPGSTLNPDPAQYAESYEFAPFTGRDAISFVRTG